MTLRHCATGVMGPPEGWRGRGVDKGAWRPVQRHSLSLPPICTQRSLEAESSGIYAGNIGDINDVGRDNAWSSRPTINRLSDPVDAA